MLAQLYEEAGRRSDAEASSRFWREPTPDFAYLDGYVTILLLQGKTSEARVWFEKLRQAGPEKAHQRARDRIDADRQRRQQEQGD